jgi:hypothetical protein
MQEKKKKAHVIFYADSPQQVGGFLKSDWKSGKFPLLLKQQAGLVILLYSSSSLASGITALQL